MSYPNMYRRNILLAASLLTLSTLLPAQDVSLSQDLSKDFDKPIYVDSETQFVDAKKKVSIFERNVVVVQGSLSINADYLRVDGSQGKGQEVFVAQGKPAKYVQTLEDGSMVEAKADDISYDVATRTIKLEGNAEFVQNSSTVSGNSITFDMDKEQILANSNGQGSQRVKTVFSPDIIDTEQVKKDSKLPLDKKGQ